jgi:hypothetical protein
VLGCVLRLEGDPSIYANTVTHDALRRLGAHPTVDAARRAPECPTASSTWSWGAALDDACPHATFLKIFIEIPKA